ncbi:MAG TPA: hypothetical protein VHX15_02315 [Frankiaceae bacterium]|jgi:hypothetical protein|nr:hypothetical protein [Frankiaceae bacterium]
MIAISGTFCTRCGKTHEEHDDAGRAMCAAGLQLEPARYCPQCARRMVVQVTPGGWSAQCSQHGSLDARQP